jgi:hypothetical protein
MAANEIHIGDIGTIFEVTLMDDVTPVDVSAASVMEIVFRKSDGTTIVTNTATFTTDGTDGKIEYKTVLDTELDVKGNWRIQGKVTLPSGSWSSDIDTFKVYENLQP